jgi:hypothetical protein
MFRDSQQWYESVGVSIGEVQSSTFQGENPRSGLNWLCLTMILLEASFESGDYLQGRNLKSFVGRRWRWCTVHFLEASPFGESVF